MIIKIVSTAVLTKVQTKSADILAPNSISIGFYA